MGYYRKSFYKPKKQSNINKDRDANLEKYPNLKLWLETPNDFVQGIGSNFYAWGTISQKQVDVVEKSYLKHQEFLKKEAELLADPNICTTPIGSKIMIDEMIVTSVKLKSVQSYGYWESVEDRYHICVVLEHPVCKFKVWTRLQHIHIENYDHKDELEFVLGGNRNTTYNTHDWTRFNEELDEMLMGKTLKNLMFKEISKSDKVMFGFGKIASFKVA